MKDKSESCWEDVHVAHASTEYVRVQKAAEILKVDSDEILHLGANGQVKIAAPMLTNNTFELWSESISLAYPSFDETIRATFGTHDRVILFTEDLKRIEGVGWCVPRGFVCPERTQKVLELWEISADFDNRMTVDADIHKSSKIGDQSKRPHTKQMKPTSRNEMQSDFQALLEYVPNHLHPILERVMRDGKTTSNCGVLVDDGFTPRDPNSGKAKLRSLALYDRWHVADEISDDAPKTTIKHLFIPRSEIEVIQRLLTIDRSELSQKSQVSSEVPTIHRNSELNSRVREQVLKAAIYCIRKWPDQCTTTADWEVCIATNAHRWWKEGRAPLEKETIERQLNAAIREPTPFDDIKAARGSKKSERK